MNTKTLVGFLIWVLVALIVLWAIHLLLGMLALPAAVKTLALVIVGVVFLVLALNKLGIMGESE